MGPRRAALPLDAVATIPRYPLPDSLTNDTHPSALLCCPSALATRLQVAPPSASLSPLPVWCAAHCPTRSPPTSLVPMSLCLVPSSHSPRKFRQLTIMWVKISAPAGMTNREKPAPEQESFRTRLRNWLELNREGVFA